MADRYTPRVELCFDKTANPEILQNWQWTNVTAEMLGSVEMSRGRQDEASRATVSDIAFQLRNDDGKYTPELATSPYYKLLDVGTPVRITEEGLLNNSRLYLNGDPDSFAGTVDHSSLDITGDIDIRADIELDVWRSDGPDAMVVASKFDTSGTNLSWVLTVSKTGTINFIWSTTGATANIVGSDAAFPIPVDAGRVAIRVTFDVDNGSGGRTANFYTSDTIDGTWTSLGPAVLAGGTTSIFSSASSLLVGKADGPYPEAFIGYTSFQGRIYAFQLRNGIGGTIVANPDFRTMRAINTTLTDSAGRAWGVNPRAAVEDPATRAFGFISSIDPEWPAGDISGIQTGHSVVAIKASGVFRAMDQGSEPLQSVMTKSTSRTNPLPIEYWPCEDGETSKQCASALGGEPMRVVYLQNGDTEPAFASYSDFVASKPVIAPNNGTFYGKLPPNSATGELRLTGLFHFPEDEAGSVLTDIRLIELNTTGTAAFWYIDVDRTTGNLAVHALSADGTSILDTGYISFGMLGQKFLLSLWLKQNGANIDYQVAVFREGALVGTPYSNTLNSRTVGAGLTVTVNPFGTANKVHFGHISYHNQDTQNVVWQFAGRVLAGYAGETAGARFVRLCEEEGVDYNFYGFTEDTAQMGSQGVDTLTNILQEAADADDAILSETRGKPGLTFRTRFDMYDQMARLELDAGQSEIGNPFRPTKDDSKAVNDSTATRKGGSSFRIVDEEDIAKRNARYPSDRTVNVASDGQLADVAGWVLRNGTLDGMRYPNVTPAVDVALSVELPYAFLNLGDKIQVSNLPSQHPVGNVELILQGYKESLIPYSYQVECNTTQAEVFDISEFAFPWNVGTDVPNRADAESSVLTTAINTSTTTLPVRVDGGKPEWLRSDLYPVEFPFDVGIAGEQMRVSLCTSILQDEFGRTVSNGWGSADTGQSWSTDGGVAGNYSVGSGTGKHTGASAGVFRTTYTGSSIEEPDVLVKVRAPVNATGDLYAAGTVLAWNGSSQFYMVLLSFNTDNTVQFFISTQAGILGAFGNTGMRYTAGDWFWLRASAFDGALHGRAWKLGDVEPSYWQAERATSANPYTGAIGCISVRGASNTNANLPFEFDSLMLNSHQNMTVTRAVNGVSKSHSAGDPVKLWTPAYLAR